MDTITDLIDQKLDKLRVYEDTIARMGLLASTTEAKTLVNLSRLLVINHKTDLQDLRNELVGLVK